MTGRIPTRRLARLVLSIAAPIVVGALLLATIYWTRFDPRWGIFLGGVLFASMLALASSASKAEWVVARRTRQLDHARAHLKDAESRSARATAAFKAVELRTRALGDALTQPVILCDRNEICCFHNRVAAREAAAELAGKSLREIFGDASYSEMRPHLQEVLAGRPAGEEPVWDAATTRTSYRVRALPHPPGAVPPEGLWLVLEAAPTPRAGAEAGASGDASQAVYLKAIARELTGWDDPRGKITRALAEDRFLLYQQKIAPLELGRADPSCQEILLRMQDEEDHHLPPGGFLPEAERFGLLGEIDRWVVRALVDWCLQQRRLDSHWEPQLYCLNLSAAALRDAGFARHVQRQLQRGLSGRALCFEIGEPEVISQPADARRLIAMLKPYGVRFTVDAFGSVKGSFAPLQGLAFDFVKIDGVVVQNVRREPTQMARVRAIATACREVGMRTIAECVEDDETLALIRRAAVDYAQGFGIARPVPLVMQTKGAALEAV